MTTAQYRKEMKQIIADLRKVSALLNSEERIDQVSGLWLKDRVERTNDYLDILIEDLETQHND
jgi:hypothetical protein